MNVVVPTPEENSPAFCALRMEGVSVVEYECAEDLSYGRIFSNYWNHGEPFVCVEHDIIPWPGLIEQFFACPKAHCSARYPLIAGSEPKLSFGIGKYRPVGPAPTEWASTEWRLLDGFVLPHVHKTLGYACVHTPPVAHARKGTLAHA